MYKMEMPSIAGDTGGDRMGAVALGTDHVL